MDWMKSCFSPSRKRKEKLDAGGKVLDDEEHGEVVSDVVELTAQQEVEGQVNNKNNFEEGNTVSSSEQLANMSFIIKRRSKHVVVLDEDASRISPSSLVPPLSSSEELRDLLLRFLDHPFFQTLGIIVLVLIILSGAFFFFLLLGWQSLCDTPSRTNCEPRNTCFNISIQILNVLFTFMAIESLPWRCTQFLHVTGWSCPYRRNDVGFDLFGMPSKEIWYHIPKARRIGICVCLLLNCFTQLANQVTRIAYPTYEQANKTPGNIWTNVFFVSSMAFAACGGAWMIYEEHVIHQHLPGVFAPSAIMLVRENVQYCRHRVKGYSWCFCWQQYSQEELEDEAGDSDPQIRPQMVQPPDHVSTPHHKHVLPVERTNARLWGL